MMPSPVTIPGTPRKRDPDLEPELELLAEWMDSAFRIPGLGIRFGLDAIVGLIPGVGDTLTSIASLYILNAGRHYGVPRVTMVRMAMNLAADYILGALPIVGDIFDVYWKANRRNVELLRRHVLATPIEERRERSGDWLFLAGLIIGLVAILIGAITAAYFLITWIGHLLGRRS